MKTGYRLLFYVGTETETSGLAHIVHDGAVKALCGSTSTNKIEWRETPKDWNGRICGGCQARSSHAGPVDAPSSRGAQQVYCGEWVQKFRIVSEPNCPRCASILAEQEAIEL